MEPASLVLGVLSFIVGGMQSYEKARQTFQTFRAYKRAVLRMKARLETQHTRFNNECKLILRLVVPTGGELKSMFEDTSHTRWKDQSLDNDLKVCLGSNYGPYRGTLECCRDSLEEVIRALSWMRNVSPSAGDVSTPPLLHCSWIYIDMLSREKLGQEPLVASVKHSEYRCMKPTM